MSDNVTREQLIDALVSMGVARDDISDSLTLDNLQGLVVGRAMNAQANPKSDIGRVITVIEGLFGLRRSVNRNDAEYTLREVHRVMEASGPAFLKLLGANPGIPLCIKPEFFSWLDEKISSMMWKSTHVAIHGRINEKLEKMLTLLGVNLSTKSHDTFELLEELDRCVNILIKNSEEIVKSRYAAQTTILECTAEMMKTHDQKRELVKAVASLVVDVDEWTVKHLPDDQLMKFRAQMMQRVSKILSISV